MFRKRNFVFLMVFMLSACSVVRSMQNQGVHIVTDGNTNPVSSSKTPFLPAIKAETATPIPEPIYLTGAGDISICGQETDNLTADLLSETSDNIFTLGDTQYNEGTYDQFVKCFGESWGIYRNRMIPVVGNHEYDDDYASGFFEYFDNEKDPENLGYYSQVIGSWHVIVLNSQCDHIGGCDKNSVMVEWLLEDLSNHEQLCTLALWHQPRFSTGYHGPDEAMDTVWRIIVENNVELVLNGHEHNYERFAPMDENGEINLSNGTRMIIVGTGGASLRPQYLEHPASVVYNASTYGVLQLMLD